MTKPLKEELQAWLEKLKQDEPRLELTEKIEANFYSQDLTPAAPQPRQNEKPAATKISGKEILEAIRLMDADERRELTRALFA
mgnify:FL=1